MNKRGQIFLMAAILITSVVIGLSTIDTEAEVMSPNEAFYDLSGEIGFETKRVLDYGVFQNSNPFAKIDDFFNEYIDYIGREQVVLIVGNAGEMKVYHYVTDNAGQVGINLGGVDVTNSITITDIEERDATIGKDGGIVKVTINEIDYEFTLRKGENFFFVIIKHEDDEKFVATG